MGRSRSNAGSGGKLVDTWHYEYVGVEGEAARPKKVEVELRLVKDYVGDEPPLAVGRVRFRLECAEPEFRLEGPDIEALRAAMWDRLDKRYRTRWTDYFLVEIERRPPYEGLGTGFSFGFKRVEKGVAWDGTLLLRTASGFGRGRVEPWPGEFKSKEDGSSLACIPATEANRDALEEFARRIDELRDRLAEFLRPHRIMETLANLGGLSLLPPGGEE